MKVDNDFKNGILNIWKLKSEKYDTIYFYGDEGEWKLFSDIREYILSDMH